MFEAFCKDPKSKSLHFCNCLGVVGPIAHHASEASDLCEPTAVLFPREFDQTAWSVADFATVAARRAGA